MANSPGGPIGTGADASSGGPLLRVERATVRFGGLTALDNVSIQAERSSVLGIIGPNGAGKTTLFNVICGFVRMNEGTLSIDGRSLRRVRPHQLSGLGISRTLQGVGLWPGLTVVENVMVGARSQARGGLIPAMLGLPPSEGWERRLREAAEQAMEDLGLTAYAGRSAAGLPYGIQKKVSLARALVSRPKVLLLDEPASGLSAAEMEEMGRIIRDLGQSMAVLLVEHHMDLVMSVCHRISVLDFGAVIATGSPEEIRANSAVTAAYLGNPVDVGQAN